MRYSCSGSGSNFWLAGWLFTLALLDFSFWDGVLALFTWPFDLGNWVQGL